MDDLNVLEAVAWRWRNRPERYGIAGATAGDWYYEARDPAFAPHSDKETEPLVRKSDADAIARERDAMRGRLAILEAERTREGVNLAHLKRAIAVQYADAFKQEQPA